jgi:hypothetical protein
MREVPSTGSDLHSGTQVPQMASSIADSSRSEERFVHVWHEWLSRLAIDAEAALAAALAYKQLDGPGRDTWLCALEQDTACVHVPRIAVYAPLLAVESDQERRARIVEAIGPDEASATPRTRASALRGVAPGGLCIATLSMPLYLDFVQVLACGYLPAEGFFWVRHDPILHRQCVPQPEDELEGVRLESTPLKSVIDELAHAVVAHTRSGRELPEALRVCADLFAPREVGSIALPVP